ncbi:arginine--tRNA ligase [Chamaesiphon minutus]|uniref:Arginine--tRNA ligase n=1 Tax=Chamaesiphon minutus (strain ATCC 27169 / PCC 6605) TaxID=1173020 RepID=K9ULA5_CHAP6|nr:arginine--tRNA ligase [Chamaesiphon minutus]AFY95438.1 arginyl-tRNA synthetase [Chamaesiphon minutus PCC 6605]
MNSTLAYLTTQLDRAIVAALGDDYAGTDPLLVLSSNPKFGDYQANMAMGLAKKLGQQPRAIAQSIVDNLDVAAVCEPPQIAGPGFINFTVKSSYLATQLQAMQADSRLGVAVADKPQRVIVDFSSPNIAKEMHVGHLRSTILGDCIARVLEFRGHDVLRLNHVGDWGTQFGMLILYLREAYPEALTTADALDLGDIVVLYQQAKKRFDEDAEFKEAARQEVVKLQAQDPESIKAWKLLCDQSRREFQVIYDRLNVNLTERGESFYNPYLAAVVEDLKATGLLVESDGAQCVFVPGFTNRDGDPLPLIVQKTDGGYNYATTDLAAIRYRIQTDKAERIIYITDAGQADHFAQVFQVAKLANWIPENVEVLHVPFGLVLGDGGKKIKTRDGESVKLKELLDEAVDRFRNDLESRLIEESRQEAPEFIDNSANIVGISAVKYSDLSQNRTSNYVFSFDKMLALQGNTAPYMMYAYVRPQGISRKGNIDYDNLGDNAPIILNEALELTLAKHLLQLSTVIAEVERDLLPNRLCQYLFELSQKYNQFYDKHSVLQAEEPLRTSRLMLCDLTAKTLKLGLDLLGIPVLERM